MSRSTLLVDIRASGHLGPVRVNPPAAKISAARLLAHVSGVSDNGLHKPADAVSAFHDTDYCIPLGRYATYIRRWGTALDHSFRREQ